MLIKFAISRDFFSLFEPFTVSFILSVISPGRSFLFFFAPFPRPFLLAQLPVLFAFFVLWQAIVLLSIGGNSRT